MYDSSNILDTTDNRKGWVRQLSIGDPVDRVGGIVVDDFQADSAFGSVVSVRYDADQITALLVVGAPLYDVTANGVTDTNAGKAYVYEWTGGLNDTIAFVNSIDGENADDHFGKAVTSNGVRILVGAPDYDYVLGGFTDNGAAYIYDYETVAPFDISLAQPVITNLTGTANDLNLGVSVSLGNDDTDPDLGGLMLIGSGSQTIAGGAYILKDSGPPALPSDDATTYAVVEVLVGTHGGDVSQFDDVAGFGYSGTAGTAGYTELYYDKNNITAPTIYHDPTDVDSADWIYEENEIEYGRDIAVNIGSTTWVMVNGNTNDVAYAYYTPCGATGELKAFKWTMIGMPCDVDGASIDEIFGNDLGTYGNEGNWFAKKQNNGADFTGFVSAYSDMVSGETMVQGRGYWIITDADQTWEIDEIPSPHVVSGTPTVTDPLSRSDIAAVHEFDLIPVFSSKTTPGSDITLMLSNPYTIAMTWGDTLLKDEYLVSDYVSSTIYSSYFEDGVPIAYVWDTTASKYTPIAATPGFTAQVESGEGYFIRFSSTFQTEVLGDAPDPGQTSFNLLQSLQK